MLNTECPLSGEIPPPPKLTPSLPFQPAIFPPSELLQIHHSLLYCTYVSKHFLSIYCVPDTKLGCQGHELTRQFLFLESPVEGVDT